MNWNFAGPRGLCKGYVKFLLSPASKSLPFFFLLLLLYWTNVKVRENVRLAVARRWRHFFWSTSRGICRIPLAVATILVWNIRRLTDQLDGHCIDLQRYLGHLTLCATFWAPLSLLSIGWSYPHLVFCCGAMTRWFKANMILLADDLGRNEDKAVVITACVSECELGARLIAQSRHWIVRSRLREGARRWLWWYEAVQLIRMALGRANWSFFQRLLPLTHTRNMIGILARAKG